MTHGRENRTATPPDRHTALPTTALPVTPGPDLRHLLRPPAPMGAAHAQARHELDLAATLVIAQPAAASSLDSLADSHRVHPGGALVLGALLWLTGHHDACQFWLQFAAGGGNATAASCLSLQHASRGEFRDAEYWREQADQLTTDLPGGADRSASWPTSPLPPAVWQDTLAACHRGLSLSLPPRVAAVVHQLPVDSDDQHHGEIPRPTPRLAHDLTRAATHPRSA
ncbi:hypothetical protein [Streptomyces sp. NRRL WC-3742]|uniref:hypothetical protein n=1 Tax=Streptomyces sp. NRRL WC-3742 TaxID=1463934 RepID=UPI000B1D854A|nr:hypothetical protein [Streptomyces sp. NRRL WC-3742]